MPHEQVFSILMKAIEKQGEKIDKIPALITKMLDNHSETSKEIHEAKMAPMSKAIESLQEKQHNHANELMLLKFFKWQAIFIVTIILTVGNFVFKFLFGL